MKLSPQRRDMTNIVTSFEKNNAPLATGGNIHFWIYFKSKV